MNIGILCYPTFGGSGVVATELGKALAQRGHRVHFITYERPVRLEGFNPNLHFHQVTAPPYPLFQSVPYESALVSTLVDVALNERLDVLHVHYAIPHASSAWFAQRILADLDYGLPFVTTLHGTDITLVGQEAAYKPVVTFSLNHSDGITSVSDFLKRATLDQFDVHRPIDVIPNFVDLQRFQPSAAGPAPCGLRQPGEWLLMHASNFRPVKRVQDVYAVFKRVRETHPVKLMMIGDGPERHPLEQQIRQDGLSKEVYLPGNQSDIETLLPMGHVFLLPSETESFGLAALEAMASGVPVVGSQVGGIPELVEHGRSGYLAPVGDVDAMADHVRTLLASEEAHASYRRRALDRARQFGVDAIVSRYERCYAQAVARYAHVAHTNGY